MNFKNMPELDWPLGYPFALVLMVLVRGRAVLGVQAEGLALTDRGRGWQRGQLKLPRFMNVSRRIGVPQRAQGRSAWP